MTTTEIALLVIAGLLGAIYWQLRAISGQICTLIKLRFPSIFEG